MFVVISLICIEDNILDCSTNEYGVSTLDLRSGNHSIPPRNLTNIRLRLSVVPVVICNLIAICSIKRTLEFLTHYRLCIWFPKLEHIARKLGRSPYLEVTSSPKC